jgi:hypothetical protein
MHHHQPASHQRGEADEVLVSDRGYPVSGLAGGTRIRTLLSSPHPVVIVQRRENNPSPTRRKAVGAISCQGIAAEHVRMHREG